jgi:hypothetical protein
MAEVKLGVEDNKKPVLSPVKEATTDGNGVDKSSPASLLTPSTLAATLAILLLGLLFRTGWTNVLLVLLCSILFLLNPWVRTFLELPPALDSSSSSRSAFSTYDPARFLDFTNADAAQGTTEATSNEKSNTEELKKPLDRSEAYAALRRMPAYLRMPIADLEELIIRDCITSWYDFHSFGDQSLPNQARYSIDHAVGSIYAALENMRSADVVSDILLTSSSVLLTTLRGKRLHPRRSPIFSSDTARINAIREAVERLLIKHMGRQDAHCDLMRTLLRELLCKQAWNAIGGIGEPDFINRSIIMWGENQQAKEREVEEEPPKWPEEAVMPSPQPSHRSSAAPSPAPSTPRTESPAAPLRQPTLSVPPSTHTPSLTSTARPSNNATASSSTTPSRSAPLTMQPRPMMMPIPSSKKEGSETERRSPIMSSSPTMYQPPPLPRRPLIDINTPLDHSPLREATHHQGDHLPNQPPSLPPRKDTMASEEAVDESAWLSMPMNIPVEARRETPLPESLRSSLKTSSVGDESVEGYRLSSESSRDMNTSTSSELRSPVLNNNRSHDSEGRSYHSNRNDEQSQSSSDSQFYQTRSRPASSASGGIPPAPDLAEVLSSTGSPSLSALRDAFEAFLERGGATSRSLFFSPPSAATVAPGEGAILLKLHYGLATIARLVPDNAKEEGEVYREDAFNTTLSALQNLNQADDGIAGRPLREALLVCAQRLEMADDGRLREVLRPVELSLWARLSGLYARFWKETCTRPAGSRPSIASPTLGSGGRASFSANRQSGERVRPSADQLHYQPRKKMSANASSSASVSKTDLGDLSEDIPAQRANSTPPNKASSMQDRGQEWQAEAPVTPMAPPPVPPRKDPVSRPVPRRAEVQPISDDDVEEAVNSSSRASLDLPSSSIEITATDVSLNADRPDAAVDIRTYEVMIAVEGLVAGGGGFVLLRTWKDLQQMQEQLRSSMLLDTSGPDVNLPSIKGQTSRTLTKDVESYLVKLLSNPTLVESEAVQYFIDKTRAGEPPSNRSTLLMESLRFKNRGLGLGKTFVSGVGVAGKTAINTLQMMPGNVAALSQPSTRNSSARGSPARGPHAQLVDDAPNDHLYADKREGVPPSLLTPAPPPRPSSSQSMSSAHDLKYDLSPQEMDTLLSCAFAIADEAFNLSGGWTLRRGLLRVLEQVVRTQYFSSIMGMFHNLAYSLNQEQIASWIVQLKEKFWPDEGAVPAVTSKDQKQHTQSDLHERRQEAAAELLVEAVGDESGAEERSSEEKLACHLKAKSIIIAQTPVGSAYFLGPGGKQSCEKALNLLHEEVTKPETSLDLVLTVFLKLCDIASSV